MQEFVYIASTNEIVVSARPSFIEDESIPHENHFVWLYHITIENKGNGIVHLLNRYWHITDSTSLVQEVKGPGVIGKQPVIRPGEKFEYTSGVNLRTPSGIMMGKYEFSDENGALFDAAIPAFSLDSSLQLARPN
jgi:ApaG protein